MQVKKGGWIHSEVFYLTCFFFSPLFGPMPHRGPLLCLASQFWACQAKFLRRINPSLHCVGGREPDGGDRIFGSVGMGLGRAPGFYFWTSTRVPFLYCPCFFVTCLWFQVPLDTQALSVSQQCCCSLWAVRWKYRCSVKSHIPAFHKCVNIPCLLWSPLSFSLSL